uniref:probable receptor-like protein kinase At5g38990 n=1 Tax=Erigeron canadensis TaxID=72917 RepID=UPI001CB9C57B|nr:probable receptor-like protein kinase At5g38990 [Erigeron canadensis]
MYSATHEGDMSSPSTSAQPCRRFSLEEIQSATNNFDDKLVIGEGGFGKVYKGRITIEETSHFVAIKRCDYRSDQGASEFRAEIEMLSKLRHCHLVSLYGFCDVEKEMILVYEYMPNGTLHDHLHKAATHLTWVQRLKIAIGAARGLDYLHTGFGTHQGVIHRDVKSSNILLDENWEALISDFGLSKIGPTNQSLSFIDASVKGTFGYLDLEYFYTGKLTRKSDVYSYGVVLFELLSGRLPVDKKYGEEDCSLVRWVQKCVKERKVDQMVDSNMSGIFPKCVKQFVQIAHPCLSSVPKERPNMTEVVASLQALLKLHEQLEASAVSPTGLTSKMHKYFGLSPKLNSPKLNSGIDRLFVFCVCLLFLFVPDI